MSYEFSQPHQVDPQQVERARLDTLDTLRMGGNYTITPDMTLYSSVGIGQKDSLPDGTKINVATEFAIPAGLDEKNRPNRFNFLVVIAANTPDGRTAYALAGLKPDEKGIMKIAPGTTPNWLYQGGAQRMLIGKDGNDPAMLDPKKLWGESGVYSDYVLGKQIVFSLKPDKTLRVEVPGRNGTWGEFGEKAIPDVNQAQKMAETQLAPSRELRFQPVEADPKFEQVAKPYIDALAAVSDKYKQAVATLKVEYQHDLVGGRSHKWEIIDKKRALYQQIADEQAPIRIRYEKALKPYLDERLRLFDGDTAAGFMHEGQLDDGRYEVRTTSGKLVSKKTAITSNGNLIFADADTSPLYGQLLMDGRYNSWGADRNKQKTDDEKGGPSTSSAQHVIDIAAAMLAGTFTGSKQPVQYRKATPSDMINRGLNSGYIYKLQDKVNFYVVKLGAHRVTAERLINGNEKRLTGAENSDNLR